MGLGEKEGEVENCKELLSQQSLIKKMPSDMAMGQYEWGNSSTEVPFFWVTLISVRVDK